MQTKKNIAFFGIKYFPSKGGTSRVAENLILNMVNDYNITVYCYKNPLAENHITGVKTVQFKERKLGNLGVLFFFFQCFVHIRFRGKYDLVHAHKIDSFLFLKWFSKRTKVVATAHEAPYNRDKWGKIAKLFFKFNEKQFLTFSGIKTAISKPLCVFYKENYDVDVKFIANGVNLSEERMEGVAMSYWPKDLKKDSPFVFFAARRIMGTKGLHTMLEAYKKINYEGNIFVAGEMDNYPAYISKIKEISKGLKVFFLGYVHPLPALMSLIDKCRYFVFPSETEGMSIMLLEVASSGKPIVASNIPENTQVFDDEDVLYFQSKDIDHLAKKLVWVENNWTKFEAKGAKARQTVGTKFIWKQITKEYCEVYNRALY